MSIVILKNIAKCKECGCELKKLTRIRKSVKLGNIQYDNFEFKPNKCPHCGEYIDAIEYENGTVFFSRS